MTDDEMTKGGNDITKEDWDAYTEVQASGLYNMFSPEALRASGLDKDTYMTIIKNYSSLEAKYEESEEDD
jgi:hypothetical protein